MSELHTYRIHVTTGTGGTTTTDESAFTAADALIDAITSEQGDEKITLRAMGQTTPRAAVAHARGLVVEVQRLRKALDDERACALGLRNELGVAKDHLDDRASTIETWRAAFKEIAAVVWPGSSTCYKLADLVSAVRKMGAERDARSAQVERQVIALRDGQRDKADLRANIQTIGEERDDLQKRIDAAHDRIRALKSNAVLGPPAADSLIAILEGREP